MTEVIIIGAGKLGKQILNHLEFQPSNIKVNGWYDDTLKVNDLFFGKPCIGPVKNGFVYDHNNSYVVAIGYKHLKFKEEIILNLNKNNCSLINYFHSSVVISSNSTLGNGLIVYAGSIIDLNVVIEDGVVLNNGVIVCHDSVIGCSSFLGPGVVVCGNVKIGKRCFIGAGSVIKDGIEICDDVVIGSGSNVIKDIKKPGVYINKNNKL